ARRLRLDGPGRAAPGQAVDRSRAASFRRVPRCRPLVAPMSSRGRETRRFGGSSGFIVAKPAEDLVADPPTESPDGLGLGVAGGHPLGQVVAAGTGPLELRDGDPVEGDVELAIATPVEPVADDVARPDRH